jgi:hypothetical protein
VEVIRKTLFESDTLNIGLVDSHPLSDACGDIEWQSSNVVVLPLRGVFSKHDGPGRQVIGTPSHAVFVAAETPYRIGFPGGVAIARSPCSSAMRWRPSNSMATAAARPWRRMACFRPAP